MSNRKKIIVGLTFDLKDDYRRMGYSEEDIAEFDTPETIEAIEENLRVLGYKTLRIGHVFDLVKFLNNGRRCDIVFNIAEGIHGVARESQIPALLDAYRIPHVFSEASVMTLTLDKALTKMVVREAGIPTAPFMVIRRMEELEVVNLPYPLFVKPVAEGTSKGIDGYSLIDSREKLQTSCAFLLDTYHQPVLLETFLPGREFTVGIVGSALQARVLGVMEIVFNEACAEKIYSYSVKKEYEKYVSYQLATDKVAKRCAELALAAWQRIDGKDAGRVDFRVDRNGQPNFVEVNPLAGLNPTYSDLPILARLSNYPYRELIDEIMQSALDRAGLMEVSNDGIRYQTGHYSA